MANGKHIIYCPILVDECIWEEMVAAVQKNFLQSIIIESNSKKILNSSNGKICVYKDIINLVYDIKTLSSLLETLE